VKLVVDASVIIPCFIPERFSDVAPSWLEVADLIVAPDLLALECANVLWKKVRLHEISPLQADETLADIVGGTVELRPSLPLTPTALKLGAELDQPIYDCIYVALAELENDDLVTADRTLWQRIADRRSTLRTHWITDTLPRTH
jgi:predicted nucleic acid-binding protein